MLVKGGSEQQGETAQCLCCRSDILTKSDCLDSLCFSVTAFSSEWCYFPLILICIIMKAYVIYQIAMHVIYIYIYYMHGNWISYNIRFHYNAYYVCVQKTKSIIICNRHNRSTANASLDAVEGVWLAVTIVHMFEWVLGKILYCTLIASLDDNL